MTNIIRPAPGTFQGGAFGTSNQSGFSGNNTTGDIGAFNSLASGSVVVASSAIPNGTNLDLFGVVDITLTSSATTTATSFVGVYLLPLHADGTTYGGGVVTGSTLPAACYWIGNILFPIGVAAGVLKGETFRFDLPRRDFKLAIAPTLGSALAASANAAVQLITTNLTING